MIFGRKFSEHLVFIVREVSGILFCYLYKVCTLLSIVNGTEM